MPVVGSDGQHVGTVDRVEGDRIKLARSDDPHGAGGHRYLPLDAVASCDGGHVTLSLTAEQAQRQAERGPSPG
ncbi:DUF2171 domain-containing protein [Caldovatus aquaticus]|uniref:DUF2171 domain-containing protein n=1 Tax=Caldovatus aquaticus TaxID=2865671 RepID=A0ABS7EXN0_9PROT|nr:DUF2171 domain-containing protein [Caldovatus aquaticus]MBW8268028.1 DUF2171 domain-containing protein [Caldovatus aquaticus]